MIIMSHFRQEVYLICYPSTQLVSSKKKMAIP